MIKMREGAFPGRFVVFCGMDGMGKTTLISRAEEWLQDQGHDVLLTKQPTDAARESPLFLKYLYEPENRQAVDYRALVCLLTSDRLQHIRDVIEPALAAGKVVISDRYFFTAIAEMRARGYERESWFEELCGHVLRPDIVFLLDAPLDVAVERIRARGRSRAGYVEMAHLEKLHREFRRVAEEEGLRLITTARPPDETAAEIIAVLESVVPSMSGQKR